MMNETTKAQSERLLAAGYPKVRLGLEGHRITVHPVPLGQLWESVHELDTWYDIPTDLCSADLVEALVRILEKHHKGLGPHKDFMR